MSQPPASERAESSRPLPVATAAPTLSYASSATSDPGRPVREIGIAQRQLMWAVLIVIALIVISFAVAPVRALPLRIAYHLLTVMWYGTAVFMMLRMYQLSVAMGYGLTRRVLYMAGMLLPYINVLVVFSVSRDATRALQRAGVRVGLMGAKRSDLP